MFPRAPPQVPGLSPPLRPALMVDVPVFGLKEGVVVSPLKQKRAAAKAAEALGITVLQTRTPASLGVPALALSSNASG